MEDRDPGSLYLCNNFKTGIQQLIPTLQTCTDEFKTSDFLDQIQVKKVRLNFFVIFNFKDFPSTDEVQLKAQRLVREMSNLKFMNELIFEKEILILHPYFILLMTLENALKLIHLVYG